MTYKEKSSLQPGSLLESTEFEEQMMSDIPVMVLAGGKGTRLKDITKDIIPKCLVRLSNGKTFLDQLLDGLDGVGFSKYIFCLGEYSDQVINHLSLRDRNQSTEYNFSVENIPLGTGGAIHLAINRYLINKPFLVVTSDAIFPYTEMRKMKKHHKPGTITWAVTRTRVSSMDAYRGMHVNPVDNSILLNTASSWYTDNRFADIKQRSINVDEYIDSGHGIIDPKLFIRAYNTFRRLYREKQTICLYKDLLPMMIEISRRQLLRNSGYPLVYSYIEKGPTLDLGTVDRFKFADKGELIS